MLIMVGVKSPLFFLLALCILVPTNGILPANYKALARDILSHARSFVKFPSTYVKLVETVPTLLQKIRKERFVGQQLYSFKLMKDLKDLVFNKHINIPINSSDIQFHLYNPFNKSTEFTDIDNFKGIKGRIFFIVHGWTEDLSDARWYQKLSENIMKVYPRDNVIQVDWGHFANTVIYPLAAMNTQHVGDIIAKRLHIMFENHGIQMENIVIIGFSLGAQISGQIGKRIFELTKKKLPLIIALEPAGPLFEGLPIDERLDKSDADRVIAVHTDTTFCGYKYPCGTIDFFPNGGKYQPGCETSAVFCNHVQGHEIFTEAILDPTKYPTLRCSNYEEFNEGRCPEYGPLFGNIQAQESGTFYFNTTVTGPLHKSVF